MEVVTSSAAISPASPASMELACSDSAAIPPTGWISFLALAQEIAAANRATMTPSSNAS